MSNLREGLIFAGCRLETVGARGGMGVVWKATQVALNRPVALKAIAPDLAENAEFRERFKRESQLTASIDHANVIPVYEAGELDGTLYLIMRWVDGTDLRHLLRRSGSLHPGHALQLLIPVAAALAAAHRRGLVHRDIKPANVLVTDDEDHVYLTDFGIARTTSSESAVTHTGALIGTVDYMAPERFEGGRGDVASDIYAFGCMLYETVTGTVPFPRSSDPSKMFAHFNDLPPSTRELSPDVPESFDAIIAKAMAKQPGDRFGSASELLTALTEAMADVDTVGRPTVDRFESQGARPPMRPRIPAATTQPPRSSAAAPPPRRRRKPLLAGAGAVLVAGGVVAAIAASGGSSDKRPASTEGGSEVTLRTGGLKVGPTVTLPGSPGAISNNPGVGVGVTIPERGQDVFLPRGMPPGQIFDVGGHPSTLAAAGGQYGAWLGCSGAGPLVRIKTASEIRARVTAAPGCPVTTAANGTDGSVWAAYARKRLIHYGAGGNVITSVELPRTPSGIAVSDRWVWVADGTERLQRIGTSDGALRRFYAGPGAVSVALNGGVWMAHAAGIVTRFNPDSLHLNANINVAEPLSKISAVEGAPAVWAIGKGGLYRIDASSLSVTGTVRFRSTPVVLSAEPERVWVGTANGHLVRIDE